MTGEQPRVSGDSDTRGGEVTSTTAGQCVEPANLPAPATSDDGAGDDEDAELADLPDPLLYIDPVDLWETDELATGNTDGHEHEDGADPYGGLPVDDELRAAPRTVSGFSLLPYGSSQLATYAIGDTGVRLSLRREVAPLLVALALRFHGTVEHLNPRTCWGHAARNVRGSAAPSRHWPGIAADLNAAAHPLGKTGTFTTGERKAITALLARFRHGGQPLFRWGGDYRGRKDEMHFELIAPRSVCLAAVKALQAPAAKKPAKKVQHPPGSRVLRLRHPYLRGADVGFVQRKVGATHAGPVDYRYGPRTERGVRWWQRQRGLVDDGVVGAKTWNAMGVA